MKRAIVLGLIIITHQLPLTAMRQVAAYARLFSSQAPRIPHDKWRYNECYLKLKADPKSHATLEMLREQSQATRQILLRLAAIKDDVPSSVYGALLEAGAKINEPDEEQQTPLHLLAQNSVNYFDETKLAAILMRIAHFNPDFDAKDSYGKTPRDYAPDKFKYLFQAQEPNGHPTVRYMHPGK